MSKSFTRYSIISALALIMFSGAAQVVAKGVYERLLSAYHIPRDCSPFR